MPLTRINGKLGVRMMGAGSGSAGGQHIYIDARGAAPGTEQKIRAMMRQISEETVARGLNSYARQAGRGGLRGGF